MALRITGTPLVFVHIPKTGGTTFRTYVTGEELGYKHAPANMTGKSYHEDSYLYLVCVRDPITWYESYFNWRGGGWSYHEPSAMWHPCWEIDPVFHSKDINEFALKCAETKYLSRLYSMYTETNRTKVFSNIQALADFAKKPLGLKANESKKRQLLSDETKKQIISLESKAFTIFCSAL